MKTKREIARHTATNGTDIHDLAVYHQIDDDTYWLQDRTTDKYGCALQQIQDASDTAVQDALEGTGWWLFAEEAAEPALSDEEISQLAYPKT